ncbi:MAG: cysteine--tRNA ligase, partial [Candidatus Omnitrophota bacterium]
MPNYIYNTLTHKKEEFQASNPPEVKMYTCGVTVYDHSHIGHARSLYVFDVIRRYLKHRGYKVKFVRNITDIDDKIINKAGELGISSQEVANKFIESYHKDLGLLEIDTADFEPKATENIDHMIKHISGLIDKGYAYQSGGDVYFRVRKFSNYGRLSGQSLDQMIAGTRKEPGENKQDPLDFALWKKSKQGEPSWDSPWGAGRPGWHIECSVMSMKYLDTDTLDIHAGGMDLVFPHHENEIAQAEALTGKQFARYWIHHGLLTINGQKMAKSLGNFVTIKDFIAKYPADALKLFFLQTHYSQPIDFTWDRIKEKQKALYDIIYFLKRVKEREEGKESIIKTNLKNIISPQALHQKVKEAQEGFLKAMDNDFNTPNAIAVLFELKNACNKILYDLGCTKEHLPVLAYAQQTIEGFGDVFGLSFKEGGLTLPG